MIDIQNFTPLYNVFYLYLLTSEKNINTEIAAFIAEGKKHFNIYAQSFWLEGRAMKYFIVNNKFVLQFYNKDIRFPRPSILILHIICFVKG